MTLRLRRLPSDALMRRSCLPAARRTSRSGVKAGVYQTNDVFHEGGRTLMSTDSEKIHLFTASLAIYYLRWETRAADMGCSSESRTIHDYYLIRSLAKKLVT